ncbi:MAG TPA: SDR family oxidoreductase [Beijerinckiaceae bacterium]|nr:SDR family oxidoreductase [Beijerinckiaceae bacterium]
MNLFAFGLGYSALHLARSHRNRFARIAGTVTSRGKAERLAAEGISALVFAPEGADPAIESEIAAADALLVSIAPDENGDPVLARFADAVAAAPRLKWIGYLSTIGVYGDRGGDWVDETTPPEPVSARSRERLAAEHAWLALGARSGRPVHVFRLAGIYGPGRNALRNLADGTAKRIVKPGQVFNRIHVDDIAAVLIASLARPRAGAIYNLADDEPAPAPDLVAYAAGLAGVPSPPEMPFAEAALGPMAASFYGESKRVANRLIKDELGVRLRHPTYREGLEALRAAGEGP